MYNVNCLVHLANEVRKWGCLDNFHAFLLKLSQKVSRFVNQSFPSLNQAIRPLSEENGPDKSVTREKSALQKEHQKGLVPREFHFPRQYQELYVGSFLPVNMSGKQRCQNRQS